MTREEALTRDDILSARADRQLSQEKLLEEFGNNLVSMTMNIPGTVKNSEDISKAFAKSFFGLVEVLKFERFKIEHIECSNMKSGPIGFISIIGDCHELKRLLVLYEDSTTIGRLLDIDLIHEDEGMISRRDLDLEPRKCFLCDEEANVCRRNQTHSYHALMDYVNDCLDTYNTWNT